MECRMEHQLSGRTSSLREIVTRAHVAALSGEVVSSTSGLGLVAVVGFAFVRRHFAAATSIMNNPG